MRKINWEAPLGEEDLRFLIQAGIPGMEERIAMHQAKFGGPEVPEVPGDTLTQSALDPAARTGTPVTPGVTEVVELPEDDEEEDDYEQWSKADLESEVTARNALAGSGDVTVEGTGSNGNVTKADLIKGLRLWDQLNPGVLS